jgi:hypothetical protein
LLFDSCTSTSLGELDATIGAAGSGICDVPNTGPPSPDANYTYSAGSAPCNTATVTAVERE